MKTIALAVAAGALLAATQANAGTFPVNTLSGAESGLVDQVAARVYAYEGHHYCFYFNGWHGPGWYRCGFANRRGFGWGGTYGWNDWSYAPYERRYHGRIHRGERFGYGEEHERRGRVGTETHSRTRTTTGVETNTRAKRSTTGRGPGAEVHAHDGAKMQGDKTGGKTGGPIGGANARGNAGAGAKAGGNAEEQKKQ